VCYCIVCVVCYGMVCYVDWHLITSLHQECKRGTEPDCSLLNAQKLHSPWLNCRGRLRLLPLAPLRHAQLVPAQTSEGALCQQCVNTSCEARRSASCAKRLRVLTTEPSICCCCVGLRDLVAHTVHWNDHQDTLVKAPAQAGAMLPAVGLQHSTAGSLCLGNPTCSSRPSFHPIRHGLVRPSKATCE
jgi:hypothetical protein